MSLLAESQIVELAALVLEIVPAGSEMMENFEEMLRAKIEEKVRAKYAPAPFMGTVVPPTSDQLKLIDFDLPFMPGVVRYIGCKAIKYAGGLMTPCGGKIKDSEFCTACAKKAATKGAHEFGTLDEREDAHEDGNKYSAGGKTEISFGDFLVAKKKTREEAKAAIRAAGFSFNIPEECFVRTVAEKKRSGRPKKADAEANEDGDAPDAPEAKVAKEKKVPLSLEEKIEKMRLADAKKKADAEAAAAKKAQKDADNAAKKAAKEIADKAAADALAEAIANGTVPAPKKRGPKKADTEAAAEAPKPKKNNKAAEKVQNILADLVDEAEEEAHVDYRNEKVRGFEFHVNTETNDVYTADDEEHKMCVGVWKDDKNTINFNTSKFARIVLAEMVEADILKREAGNLPANGPNGEHISAFIIESKLHEFHHNTNLLRAKKTGDTLWAYDASGEFVSPSFTTAEDLDDEE
jgi:hypothetical protein